MFHTNVASILSRCCICFVMAFQVFLGVFASVSDACFKCFIFLEMHVAKVLSGCFKSRSGVTHGMRVEAGGGASPHMDAGKWQMSGR